MNTTDPPSAQAATLLDLFAAAALLGLAPRVMSNEDRAAEAYDLADAMLAERTMRALQREDGK